MRSLFIHTLYKFIWPRPFSKACSDFPINYTLHRQMALFIFQETIPFLPPCQVQKLGENFFTKGQRETQRHPLLSSTIIARNYQLLSLSLSLSQTTHLLSPSAGVILLSFMWTVFSLLCSHSQAEGQRNDSNIRLFTLTLSYMCFWNEVTIKMKHSPTLWLSVFLFHHKSPKCDWTFFI